MTQVILNGKSHGVLAQEMVKHFKDTISDIMGAKVVVHTDKVLGVTTGVA